MREVPIHGGSVALVDDEDFAKVSAYKWYLSNWGYAVTTVHVSGNKKIGCVQVGVSMARLVMGCSKGDGTIVDHKNGVRLDNRKSNLRLTNYRGNAWNTKAKGGSGLKGVYRESKNSYVARINRCTIGYYPTAELAGLAFDREARELHGEFACLNYPDVTDYSHVVANPPKVTGERTSSVRGVSYSHTRRAKAKWRCVFRKVHLGWFVTEAEAIAHLESVKNAS